MSGWEIVLRGGRVIDPESGFDAVADVAIGAGRVAKIGACLPAGPTELAAEAGVPTFTHARDLIEMVPHAAIDGAEEIVRAAGQTGAHMHYCHVNSTSQRHIDRVLGLVSRAQAAGARITTEAYPYGSGMTAIGARSAPSRDDQQPVPARGPG